MHETNPQKLPQRLQRLRDRIARGELDTPAIRQAVAQRVVELDAMGMLEDSDPDGGHWR